MLLEGKHALMFAASGAIASDVSRRFADQSLDAFLLPVRLAVGRSS